MASVRYVNTSVGNSPKRKRNSRRCGGWFNGREAIQITKGEQGGDGGVNQLAKVLGGGRLTFRLHIKKEILYFLKMRKGRVGEYFSDHRVKSGGKPYNHQSAIKHLVQQES